MDTDRPRPKRRRYSLERRHKFTSLAEGDPDFSDLPEAINCRQKKLETATNKFLLALRMHHAHGYGEYEKKKDGK